MSTADTPRVLVYEKLRAGDEIQTAFRRAGLEAALPFGPESALLRQRPLDENQIVALARGFQAVMGASGAPLSRRVLEQLPELRVISKIGIGHDVIDVDAATELGIVVTNTPAPSEIGAVAEHTIALMLAMAKRLYHYDTQRMRDGGWLDDDVPSTTIAGSVIGLIGFGRIAQAVAQRLEPWGATVLAADLSEVEPRFGVEVVSLAELLRRADFISLHAASSHGARPILDAARLGTTKCSAVVVNTARGALIDHDALAAALREGRLAAAGLDVFEPEPPGADSPLLALPNVMATPHSAAAVTRVERDMELMAVQNARLGLAGERPLSVVNPALYDGDAGRRRA